MTERAIETTEEESSDELILRGVVGKNLIETSRGQVEPLAISHFYLSFDERGNLFADPFTEHYKVDNKGINERIKR
ncbi:hypothetical protein B1B04_08910 [Lysinibacillus sp. KCTC 33748]|uniref:hypothetical protein n=1 Tax=unclassified Lysinibacillus TaxID=2636778 RepID=UPI0009A6E139|nr:MULTISPECIES: hypothetical protein [unclassified Lysinibacillus]OXS74992.1 hypothetical protein B1B04_08910 [Lysinibacillus sp. KCTC 33748]SKB61453.1 hypothetical protein SAMN06295926_104269 [Lysinibacillus sp. AC-3]